jgi:hypothetical protein
MRQHTSRGTRASHARRRWMTMLTLAVVSTAWLSADTLIMRNGRRINGRLVGVRDNQVEFEEQGYRSNVIRVDRRDISSIEFNDDDRDRPGSGGGWQGGGGGRPPGGGGNWGDNSGMRERDVMVAARDEWTDTSILVRAGQVVRFRAVGKVRWGPGRNDGPEGEKSSPYNAGRPMPNRNAAALIGRVGEDAPFFIGDDSGEIRVRSSGRLYLGINDDYLQDNSGSFRVTVYY